jgi:hypothetical protein
MYLYIDYEDLFVRMLISEVTEGLRSVALIMTHITAVIIKFTIDSLHIYSLSQITSAKKRKKRRKSTDHL